jgi:alkylation response protein AidB-like acyl-CoA dehydrogenase
MGSDATSQIADLRQAELYRHYVPRSFGGEFQSFEHVGALLRTVARGDLPEAISHAITLLGTVVVWLAGDPSQQRALAGSVLAGEPVSVALTELASGSDLLAATTAARPSRDGYRLTGEKWLGHELGRHRFLVVHARTSVRSGPRGFSHFLLDKQAVPAGVRASRPRPTPGVHGPDVRGVHFDAQLPRTALIGAEGSGFEVILKAIQVARTMCGMISLGALDTALDTVLGSALQCIVDGQRLAELPQSQKLLVEAWADLLICDSVTGVALRSLHAVPSQASVHSAVVKYLVPTLAEQAMQKLAVVHGARALWNTDDPGIFERLHRDSSLVSMFDGGAQVVLFNLCHQLRSLVIHGQPADLPRWVHHASEPAELDWTRFSLSARGRDAVLAGFDAGCHALRAATQRHASDEVRRSLEIPVVRLAQARDELFGAIRLLSHGAFAAGDPEAMELARRYCVVAAAAAVVADCQVNHAALASTLADPALLAVALHRLAGQLGELPLLPARCYRDGFTALLAHHELEGRCGQHAAPARDTSVLS